MTVTECCTVTRWECVKITRFPDSQPIGRYLIVRHASLAAGNLGIGLALYGHVTFAWDNAPLVCVVGAGVWHVNCHGVHLVIS